MLSMKAKYAIRALSILAQNEKKMLQSKVIAKAADVPQKFLEAILLQMKGFVDSKRGIFGGYFLAKPAKEITLGTLIRLIDGPLAPTRCASISAYQKCDDCVDEATCQIRKAMIEVRDAIAGVLDNKTINQLVTTSNYAI
jgi:Rrf2 family protein